MPDREELIAKLLAAPCIWPCECARKYQHWRERIPQLGRDDAKLAEEEAELDMALIEMQLVFACMAERAGNKKARVVALIELLRPTFDDDKVGAAHRRLEAADCFVDEAALPRPSPGPFGAGAKLTGEARDAEIASERRRTFRNVKGTH